MPPPEKLDAKATAKPWFVFFQFLESLLHCRSGLKVNHALQRL
jgi:hypothetical protein